ncbi:hypothetical protein FM106_07920 [Brachybacterium faecium]|nr:hypothetical protein FM106_07920 [Brachybacterium faecium]
MELRTFATLVKIIVNLSWHYSHHYSFSKTWFEKQLIQTISISC